jgi:hypothetical protein
LGWRAIPSATDDRTGDGGQSHREGQQHQDEHEPAGALPGPPGAAFTPELIGAEKGPQTVSGYYHLGWGSIIGYAIAAIIAVAGFALEFRDLS